MLKDFFQKNIETLNDLRSEHFKYSQYLNKGKYKMKQKFFGKGKKHYDFDVNSQQYFHQQIDDISFKQSQVQQAFFNMINKATSQPLQFAINDTFNHKFEIPNAKNPSQCRLQLARHFRNRINNLKFKKYLILERFSNVDKPQELVFINSRTNLIDKQIISALNREIRLNEEDYFQQSFTLGGKPVPISQTGQPIYKYLDEEQCWFSNISREDIIVYSRNIQFKRQILNQSYFPIQSQMQSLIVIFGIDILNIIQDLLQVQEHVWVKDAEEKAKDFNSILQKQLQVISPGNLAQKQNLTNFGYTIFGIICQRPLALPLYPAIYPELIQEFNNVAPLFFKNLKMENHKQIVSLIPKFNSFCQIIFKYQNKQILQGKKQIKLGLQDDIDVKKQLFTMLEEVWVRKHVTINFQRYQYKLQLQPIDWPIQTITAQFKRINQNKSFQQPDQSIQQLIKLLPLTDFHIFRKHMKKRSEIIVQRSKTKYFDMEKIIKFNSKSDQKMTLDQLSQLFKIKFDQNQKGFQPFLKPNAEVFFNQIMKKYWIMNPAEIQIEETLKILKIREHRTKLINVLNAARCYQRNISLDLRVLSGQQFKFKLDDQFLINSNKQVIQNFQKAAKQTAIFFQKEDQKLNNGQDFVLSAQHKIPMTYKKDVVQRKYFGETVPHLIVSYGKRRKTKIIYQIVLDDIKSIEQRITKNLTIFINRYQRYIKVKQLSQIVDRAQILCRIYQLQLKFHYAKFNLIQKYLYIYENTTNVLQAFKISKIIAQLVHRAPQIDEEQTNFEDCYNFQINAFQGQLKALQKFIIILKNSEQQKTVKFHQNYAQHLKIPLTVQAYIYGDLQMKQKIKSKLQRMNSMSSKVSRGSSKGQTSKEGGGQTAMRQQIKQEFQQDSDQQKFDLQNYDEYMLKKDMDAIFGDMIQTDQNKESAPVNTVAVQNITINPRFQGGPHPPNYALSTVSINSQESIPVLNFYQTLSYIANLNQIIKKLQQEFITTYGFVSKKYVMCLAQTITKFIQSILLSPKKLPPKWKQWESQDSYHETVTQAKKFYQQMMAAALDPPSNIQMAIASTLQKHQQKLPTFNQLIGLDYHSIESLICLKKPVNSATYKQLALGINYLWYLQLKYAISQIQLKRQRFIQAYQNLGKHCQANIERYGHLYSRSGQNDSLLAIQQIRQYREDVFKYPVLPQVVKQLKLIVCCQYADLQLLETIVRTAKVKLQNFVRMKMQVGKKYKNSKFDTSRLLSTDQKNIKMIKNRIIGLISNISSEEFKRFSFMKIKEPLKARFQKQLKKIQQTNNTEYLILPKEKLSPFSVSLLLEKFKKKHRETLIQLYTKDLVSTNVKNIVLLQTTHILTRIKHIINSSPYLSKLYRFGPQFSQLQRTVFYDQKKSKSTSKIQGQIIKDGKISIFDYIYSNQQLTTEWQTQESFTQLNNLNQFQVKTTDFSPPKDKNYLFKWIFNIPDMKGTTNQKEALKSLINCCPSFTGNISQSEYLQQKYISLPPRNKFLTIYEYYLSLLQYLQSCLVIINLQLEADMIPSMNTLLTKQVHFQQAYPLQDQVSVHQSLESLQQKYMKSCFNFKSEQSLHKGYINQKLQKKRYTESKSHWAVFDQVIDFVTSKIQGRGLIRKHFLPFYQELKVIQGSPMAIQIIKTKTQLINTIVILSTYETYTNQQQLQITKSTTFHQYIFRLNKWLINNQLEQYKLVDDRNCRINISRSIEVNQKEQERFCNGLYDKTSNSVMERFKSVLLISSANMNKFISEVMNESSSSQDKDKDEGINLSMKKHNFSFLKDGVKLLNSIGEQNRLKLFARVRYFYQKSQDYLKIKSDSLSMLEKQTNKLKYVQFLWQNKIQNLKTLAFSQKLVFPIPSIKFKSASSQLKQLLEINTYTIFDKFQNYKNQNKIQFNKTELGLMSSVQSKNSQIYNVIVREVICSKLAKQQFKARILADSIRVLRNQKIPKIQQKKIVNTSLIPRVHLISSFSSPLILQRKTYISQQYKLAFAQAFINRFRNKVSRVDLLSSGYGFVITVPDLQDCINFMNKLLFTFNQKEFKYRLETYMQYFQILVDSINQKNRTIKEQNSIIKFLQQKVDNIMEAQYLGKVTKLLFEKTILADKLKVAQQTTKGLEDRVRKTVQIQYDKRIKTLQSENQILKNKFHQFKELFVILSKDSAKNNFLNVVNSMKDKVSEILNKKIDLLPAFQSTKTDSLNKNQIRKQNHHNLDEPIQQQQKELKDRYLSNDLQRCKIGEDIIHDPYYVTKLITKMRLFNIFKLGCKRINFDKNQSKKTSQLKQLHKIQDTVIAQSERQLLIRQELKRTQEELSKKVMQVQKLKQTNDNIENQRTKLKILMVGKDKKIQQKEREALQTKLKLQQYQKNTPTISLAQSKMQKIDDLPKLSQARQIHKKKIQKVPQKSPFITNIQPQGSLSLYQRFQLSNKDTTWRQKCEQLYMQNKKLQSQLQKLQSGLTTPTREGFSLNLRDRAKQRKSESLNHISETISVKKQEHRRFPNLSFKYSIMKQTQNYQI